MFQIPFGTEPVKFHPYTSCVLARFLTIDCGYETGLQDSYRETEDYLISVFNSCGIKAYTDNKIVFECKTRTGQTIYYGFYDWHFSVGFGVETR